MTSAVSCIRVLVTSSVCPLSFRLWLQLFEIQRQHSLLAGVAGSFNRNHCPCHCFQTRSPRPPRRSAARGSCPPALIGVPGRVCVCHIRCVYLMTAATLKLAGVSNTRLRWWCCVGGPVAPGSGGSPPPSAVRLLPSVKHLSRSVVGVMWND